MTEIEQINDKFIYENIHLFTNKKVIIITGAGISVSSGIPDFRSQNGIFKSIREKLGVKGQDLFNYRYSRDKETRPTYYKFIADLKELVDKCEPSQTHLFFNKFKKYQKKMRIYTQNIDMLEEKSGCIVTEKTNTELVYLHGNLQHLICVYCGYRIDYTDKENEIFKLGEDVSCIRCVEENKKRGASGRREMKTGYLHTNIIHYEQPHNDAYRIGKLFEKDLDVDLFIVVGTSLKVYGVKDLVKRGLRNCINNNGRSVFVNLEDPNKEFKGLFDYFWKGKSDDFCVAVEKGIEMMNISKGIEKIKIRKDKISKKNKDFLIDKETVVKLESVKLPKEIKNEIKNVKTYNKIKESCNEINFEFERKSNKKTNKIEVKAKNTLENDNEKENKTRLNLQEKNYVRKINTEKKVVGKQNNFDVMDKNIKNSPDKNLKYEEKLLKETKSNEIKVKCKKSQLKNSKSSITEFNENKKNILEFIEIKNSFDLDDLNQCRYDKESDEIYNNKCYELSNEKELKKKSTAINLTECTFTTLLNETEIKENEKYNSIINESFSTKEIKLTPKKKSKKKKGKSGLKEFVNIIGNTCNK
ncbi:NAD-dependent deacetylase hst3 [Conglomerata obtusa]